MQQFDRDADRMAHPDRYCADKVFLGVRYREANDDGCKKVDVFTRDRQLRWRVQLKDHVGAFAVDGGTLAVEVGHWPWNPFDSFPDFKPERIEVFNVEQKVEECSLDLRRISSDADVDFTVSSSGLLAVVINNQISVY